MTLRERLNEDSKEALRARAEGRVRLSVLRMLLAAVRNVEIDRKRTLEDEEVLELVQREVKQRQDALADLAGHGRDENEAQLQAEIAVLRAYLPAMLSPEELQALAREAVAEAGATTPAQTGKVMALLMPRVKGRADGSAVSAAVRRLLGGA